MLKHLGSRRGPPLGTETDKQVLNKLHKFLSDKYCVLGLTIYLTTIYFTFKAETEAHKFSNL